MTSKILCGLCGRTYWRNTVVSKKNTKVYWNCSEYVQRGRHTKNNRSPQGEKSIKYNTINSSINNVSISGTADSYYFDFDASLSNSIYGNSNTVQPPAVVMNYIIKY